MELWERLLAILRIPFRQERRYFALDEPLQAALEEHAERDQLPVDQLQAGLLAAGLAGLQNEEILKHHWQNLSPREQEVTALTCLGYTNRQMAACLRLTPGTIKGYVHQALVKFDLHGKEELRVLLAEWDFSAWAPPGRGN